MFPVGTDDRIPTDKGDYASGAIGAGQSQQITSSSTVLLKRWVMGELQSDGSVSFGTTVTEATAFKFTESFTAGAMNARINNLMTIQFLVRYAIIITVMLLRPQEKLGSLKYL